MLNRLPAATPCLQLTETRNPSGRLFGRGCKRGEAAVGIDKQCLFVSMRRAAFGKRALAI